MMKIDSKRSFKCGSLALHSVARALKSTNHLAELMALGSPSNGFSMAELSEIADRYQIGLIPARRVIGSDLPVPSVVHWKQNHYAAIVDQR